MIAKLVWIAAITQRPAIRWRTSSADRRSESASKRSASSFPRPIVFPSRIPETESDSCTRLEMSASVSCVVFAIRRRSLPTRRVSTAKSGMSANAKSASFQLRTSMPTVVATMVGMLVLNWKLALFAFALIPLFAVLTRRVGNERRRIAKTTQETLADISSLVQESLSVSGILLGKTMGRGDELADRFEADSLRLADLEVRQRMAGRWVMASIQTSFAIMPAAVYWFGGLALAHGSTAVSLPLLVAFTTLQTRLFFPIGSLLGVGLDVQTSLALFDRIFEYLDQPVDIEEKPDAVAVGQAGDVVFDRVWFR